MPSLQDVIVGKLALRRDLVSAQVLMQCVGEQRDGSSLGQVLVRRQLISPSSLVELIQTAERTELACPRCHQAFTAGSLDPRNGVRCPRCGGTLTMVLDGEELSDRFTTGRTAKMHRDDLPPRFHTRPDATPSPSIGNQTVTGSKRFSAPGRAFSGTFGHYEILEELGRGGMGVVYRARQPNLERSVALKILLAGELASENQIKRFHREAEIAARLKHPGIVQIHDVGKIGEFHYFTMDFVDGEPLSTLIKGRRLGIRRAVEIARDVARALEHAHQRGAIHRDVKPANILIDKEGQAVITDFGLARDLDADDQRLTRTGAVVGTPYYMSPEQARGARDLIGPLSDVYSLGVVLFESLTFQLPFRADTQLELTTLILTQDAPSPTSIEPAIDRDVETIVLKTLAKELRDRYQTAGELADDLDRYLRGDAIRARRPGPVEQLMRLLRRHSGVVGGLVAACLLLTGGFVALRAYVASIHAGAATAAVTTPVAPPPPPVGRAVEAVQAVDQALAEARDCHGGDLYRRTLERVVRLATDALSHPENKDDTRLLLLRGVAAQRIQRDADAAADFRKVAELDPSGAAGAEATYRLLRLRMHVEGGGPSPEVLDELAKACRTRSGAQAGAWGELLAALQLVLRDQDAQGALSRLIRAKSLDERVPDVHYLEGMTRAQLGNERELDLAERALDRARSIDDKDSMVWFTLAKLHANRGHLNQALDDLGRALDLEPSLTEALLIRAQIAMTMNRPESAVSDLRQVLEQKPDDTATMRDLARLLSQLPGREAEVDQLLARLEKVAPGDPTPYMMRVTASLLSGRAVEAVEQLQRAQARAPADSELRAELTERLLDLALQLEQQARVVERAERTLSERPTDAEAIYLLVNVRMLAGLRAKGDQGAAIVAQARELLARGLAAQPRHRWLRQAELNLAVRVLEPGDPAFKELVERYHGDFARDPGALAYLAKIFAVALGDLRQAEALARQALDLDRRCSDALGIMAHVAAQAKQFDDARQLALAAHDAAPLPATEWLTVLGVAEAEMERFDAALEAFQQALSIDPLDASSANSIASILLRRGKNREAVEFCRRWMQLRSQLGVAGDPRVARAMAEGLTRLQDYANAARVLEDLVQAFPEPELVLDLVEVYGQWGRLDRARVLVDQVLQRDPGNKRAQQLKQRLGG